MRLIHVGFWLGLWQYVETCGVGVHVQILGRVREYLPQDMQTQSTFSIPGSFFPDAFYSCMSQSESAELAHWPSFLEAATRYYRDTYKTIDNPEGVGLRAFLFGVLTHQIADVSWHSLGVDQGLLAAMAIREFEGDYASAHSVLDMGGDLIMSERLLRSGRGLGWVTQRWSVPSRDIINIYSYLKIDINRAALEYCMARGVAALSAELNIAHTMYPTYAMKSTLLMDGLEDYFLGGMHEMTSSIVKCLGNLTRWLEDGPDDDAWSLCEVFAGRAPSTTHYHESEDTFHSVTDQLESYIEEIIPDLNTSVSKDGSLTFIDFPDVETHVVQKRETVLASDTPIFLSTGMSGSQFGSSFAFGEFRGESVGPCVAISAPYEFSDETGALDGAVYVIPLSDIEGMFGFTQLNFRELQRYRLPLPPLNDVLASRRTPHNATLPRRFGASLAAVKYFNATMLAVTSPGISTIDIFAGAAHLMTILPPSEDATTVYGARGRKLFGTELHVHDLDQDGFPDLVVSAPQSDLSGNVREQGEIMVLSGREIEVALMQGFTSIEMDLVRLSRLLRPVNIIPHVAANTEYELFGSRIAFSDHDGTEARRLAYIGASGSGAVYAFDAVSGEPLFGLFPTISSLASSTGFGGGVLLTGFIQGLGEWVLVGSPNESLDNRNLRRGKQQRVITDASQTGLCYLYLVRDKGKADINAKLLAYVIADTEDPQFGKFGYDGNKFTGASRKNTVFISSPFTESGSGGVFRLEIEDAIFTFLTRGDVDTMAASVVRVRAVAQGSVTARQTESWFGKSVAAVATDSVSGDKGQVGYLFVGVPHFGFGDMGNKDKTGAQLVGGVAVYSV